VPGGKRAAPWGANLNKHLAPAIARRFEYERIVLLKHERLMFTVSRSRRLQGKYSFHPVIIRNAFCSLAEQGRATDTKSAASSRVHGPITMESTLLMDWPPQRG
jgi:hypothetical protein